MINPEFLAGEVSAETGLVFEGRAGEANAGEEAIELHPDGHLPAETFLIRCVIGWRRIDVHFESGAYSGELLTAMRQADEAGRAIFRAVLDECVSDDAVVNLGINGVSVDLDTDIWSSPWDRLTLTISRGMLPLNDGAWNQNQRLVLLWTGRMAAAVLAILPLEESESSIVEPGTLGLPEGALTRVEVNRYERDKRNRAAALAIHGYRCLACDADMGELYGPNAAGLIQVHHTTPVSKLGADYVIDPATDLVSLCPNCHAVAHRKDPPFTLDELRTMFATARAMRTDENG